jgi:ABC-2 type transport system ATP-binding protein
MRHKQVSPASDQTVILVSNLTKRFDDQLAVDDLSFSVARGNVTGFLGPNGAGKSTTLRAVLGLIEPTSGTTEVLGAPYRELGSPGLIVGALLETDQFHPLRSGRSHLRIVAAAIGADESRINEVLDVVDLRGAAKKKVGKYSLGMKQRLGLAAALLGDPDLLILDEPSNGLDPAGMRWLRRFLRSYAETGRTVLVSSHLLGEMSSVADDVVVINKGRSVLHAKAADLDGNLEDIFFELTEKEDGDAIAAR